MTEPDLARVRGQAIDAALKAANRVLNAAGAPAHVLVTVGHDAADGSGRIDLYVTYASNRPATPGTMVNVAAGALHWTARSAGQHVMVIPAPGHG